LTKNSPNYLLLLKLSVSPESRRDPAQGCTGQKNSKLSARSLRRFFTKIFLFRIVFEGELLRYCEALRAGENVIKLLVFVSDSAANKLEHFIFTCFPHWFNACINVMNKHSNKLIKLLIFVSDDAVNKLEH
jgi:hypothetical protein